MWSFLKAPMVRIRIGRRVFAPSVLNTSLVLVLLPFLLSLGHWQLSRGSEKAARQLAYEARGREQPVDAEALAGLLRAGEDIRFRAVSLVGHYADGAQLLLDNQPHEGRPGYHVLTVFVTQGRRILVDRGWVPAHPDRRQLPAVAAVPGELVLRGRVAVPEPAFRLGNALIEGERSPWRVQALDLPALRGILGEGLQDYVVQLDRGEAHGYLRDWRPAGLNPERHFGYAVQWFALGSLLSILYFVLNFRREESDGDR
ncbi:MAG: SURF1 family protein [Gammaproteobacteria bacterium]|nr:SURF1 family protein [Gammaproteobacteria bacterium]